MFNFTLVGRVSRKLVYIGHTVLMIEADRENSSFVSCIVRDERLKKAVDKNVRTNGSVRVEGRIEWFHAVTPHSACSFFHFVAETVVHADEGVSP